MLQVSTAENLGAPTWGMDWRVVDGALRAIAKRRAGLDADEARWLREADAIQVWRPLGMVNALDYLERVLGYSPRVGQERLPSLVTPLRAARAGSPRVLRQRTQARVLPAPASPAACR